MKKVLLSMFVALGIMTSCEKEIAPVVADIIFAEGVTTTPALTTAGGTATITFSSAKAWTAEVEADKAWCTISPASGEAGQEIVVTITATKNETYDNRTAKITIISDDVTKDITVKQWQVDVLSPVSAATFRVVATNGTFSVTHNTNITDLVVTSKPEWVTEVTTRAAVNKIHNFTTTPITVTEYGRYGEIVFKSTTTGETISYTVHQGNIVTNTANATDHNANTLKQTIIDELGASPISHIKVLGTINSADFTTLKTMSHIDISEATVVGKIYITYRYENDEYIWESQEGNAIPYNIFAGTWSATEDKSNYTLKQIILPSNITTIGRGAFRNCRALSKITLPLSVTAIEIDAFYQCIKLEQMTLHEGLTSIEMSALGECAFVSITIPSTMTIINPAVFQDNKKLISVVIPGTVKEICFNAFQDCSSLVNVTLNEGLNKIGSTSFEHTAIESIQLPASLTTMSNTIFANSKLKEIISLSPTPPSTKSSFYGLAKIPFITVRVPAGSVDTYKEAWAKDVFQEVYHPTTQEITYVAIK